MTFLNNSFIVVLKTKCLYRTKIYLLNFEIKMSCCPPNSHKYLPSTYKPVGTCCSFQNTEYYMVGSPNKNAILIIPDVFGWNGCRIRNIADQLAEGGYYVIIPKLLIPNFEGGTDGDGLPADFFETKGAMFGTYISTITWEGNFCLLESFQFLLMKLYLKA